MSGKWRCPSVSPVVEWLTDQHWKSCPFLQGWYKQGFRICTPLSETCQTDCWRSDCCRGTTGRMCVFLKSSLSGYFSLVVAEFSFLEWLHKCLGTVLITGIRSRRSPSCPEAFQAWRYQYQEQILFVLFLFPLLTVHNGIRLFLPPWNSFSLLPITDAFPESCQTALRKSAWWQSLPVWNTFQDDNICLRSVSAILYQRTLFPYERIFPHRFSAFVSLHLCQSLNLRCRQLLFLHTLLFHPTGWDWLKAG